jgi:quinol monooxygenase YgiN
MSRASQPVGAEIVGTSRIEIFEGSVGRFREIAQRCLDIVRSGEPGTIEYRFFIDASSRRAFVHERYRDSAAGLEHMRNIGPMMRELAEVCTMQGEVCGEPDAELRDALVAAGVTIYAPIDPGDRTTR